MTFSNSQIEVPRVIFKLKSEDKTKTCECCIFSEVDDNYRVYEVGTHRIYAVLNKSSVEYIYIETM